MKQKIGLWAINLMILVSGWFLGTALLERRLEGQPRKAPEKNNQVNLAFSEKEPTIDGQINKEEWADATKIELNKLTLYFKHGENHLFVGMVYPKQACIGTIFIQPHQGNAITDTTYVLHCSAALGEIKYNYDKKKTKWLLERCRNDRGPYGNEVDEFEFDKFHALMGKYRTEGKSDEEALKMAIEEYEKDKGWASNLIQLTSASSQFEYRISYTKLGIDPTKIKPDEKETIPIIKLVAGVYSPPGTPVTWPKDLKDDSAKEKIHSGYPAAEMKFEPKTWATLISSDNWLKPKGKEK